MDNRDADKQDAARLRYLAVEPFCDVYAGVDLHEEACVNAFVFGRNEPNGDDYVAALRTAIDAAMDASNGTQQA
jgi:hypothetical protein